MLVAKIWPNGEFWVGGVAASSKGLVDPPKNHRSPKGAHGMTASAKRMVRQATFVLEETYGYSNLTLFTGTLPGTTDEECRQALENWTEINRQFIQEVRRLLVRSDFPPWFVGATEIQPKRFEATGQPWPHLHLVLPTKKDGDWLISGKTLKGLWASIASRRLGVPLDRFTVSGRVDRFKNAGAVGRYLSKYLAKGQTDAVLEVLNDEVYPRVRNWHHCSHDLSNVVKACTSKLTNSVSRMLYRFAVRGTEGCNVWAEIEDPNAGIDLDAMPLGFIGSLAKELHCWLLEKDELERA